MKYIKKINELLNSEPQYNENDMLLFADWIADNTTSNGSKNRIYRWKNSLNGYGELKKTTKELFYMWKNKKTN